MKVEGSVVVVTGASSGVGRATALAFADAGAKVVLAARGSTALEEAAAECRGRGAPAIAVEADVADADAVERLAQAAVDAFGRIDVWASIAGVGAVGPFLASPIEEHATTVATNLLGPLHGAYAALKRFDAQGSGGVILHMNSVGGVAAAPYGVGYSAAKFGLRGLSLALRAELANRRDVHLCEVYAAFIDTPGIDHAANRLGKKLRPAPLVAEPERVGALMVDLVRRPRAEASLTLQAAGVKIAAQLMPRFTAWALGRFVEGYAALAEPEVPRAGAAMAPAAGPGATRGGVRSTPLRIVAGVGAGLAAVGLLAAAARGRGRD